jgi:predicted transcriptional regulator YdeE
MQVLRVPTTNGIDDIKLIGDTDLDNLFIKQLAQAGTLSCINKNVEDFVIFRAISNNSNTTNFMNNIIIPRGQFLVFKTKGNMNDYELERNDLVQGIVQDVKIEAPYLGGDTSQLENFDVDIQINL